MSAPQPKIEPRVYWRGSDLFVERAINGQAITWKSRWKGTHPFNSWERVEIGAEHLASETSATPKIEPPMDADEFLLKEFPSASRSEMFTKAFMGTFARYYSAYVMAHLAGAASETSGQQCPTCGTDIRCIHGKDFRETCEPCEAPLPASEAPSAATPDETEAKLRNVMDEARGLMKVVCRMIWAREHGLRIGRDDAMDGSAYVMRLAHVLGLLPELNGAKFRDFCEQLTGLSFDEARASSTPAATPKECTHDPNTCEMSFCDWPKCNVAVTPASAVPSEVK